MIPLAAHGLVKRYGKDIVALQGIDIVIEAGGVFGLLGPNGAGKSTFLRIAVDLVRPTAGTVSLFGGSSRRSALRRIGAFIEGARFPPFLTACEVLDWIALTAGVSTAGSMGLLTRVGLAHAATRRVDGFSMGMKQRLGIASTMIGAPDLIILDEPTNGLDPAGIAEMRALVRDLADRDGVTVLLSSHMLGEVQRVCDRVAIIDHGRVMVQGSIAELVSGPPKLRIRAEPIAEAARIIGSRGERDGAAIVARLPDAEAPAVIAALCAAGVSVFEASWQNDDLESVFLKYTGA